MKSFQRYLDLISTVNGLAPETDDSPEKKQMEWLFYPGMLQESCSKWWADFGTRATCHEGVDICFYRFGSGPVTPLAPGALVPAMARGQVLHISGDLLGSSVVVSCPGETGNNRPVMVYSHLEVSPGLSAGDEVSEDSLIGRTFDTRTKKSRLLSHLHISCICLPEVAPADLNWTLFMDRDRVFHLNPVFL